MDVFGERVAANLSIAAAHANHRHLALKGHEGLQHTGLARNGLPSRIHFVRTTDDDLPLAVVTEAACLEDGGQSDTGDGGPKLIRIVHFRPRSDVDVQILEQLLFVGTVLRTGQ